MLLKVKTIAVCIHTLGYSSLFYDQFKEDPTSYVCTNVINGISTVFYFVFFLSSQKSSKLPSISRMLDRCTLRADCYVNGVAALTRGMFSA